MRNRRNIYLGSNGLDNSALMDRQSLNAPVSVEKLKEGKGVKGGRRGGRAISPSKGKIAAP